MAWDDENVDEVASAVDDPLFARRVAPHRSLTPQSFRLVMALFTLTSVTAGLPFVLFGAWPVAGFIGLDVALLYLAFRANFKAARAYEDILVTPLELMLAKVTATGQRREWRFNPAWVRLDREDHEEFGLRHLSLSSRGRVVEVAPFLGPAQRADLASDLAEALNRAKRGHRFS